jgi:flavorubredoxin
MKAVKIKENIYWVGAIDHDLRNFHGYLTQRGSTYNAYLIIDEKVTLIDAVKSYMKDEMFERISSVIDPSKIDYVVSNHVEMDHSGALPAVMEIAKNAVLVTSPNGEKGLREHFQKGPEKNDWNFRVVKTGDTLSLGKRSLQFILTPMVHWPDNMMNYMPEEKILFSNDAFGQHLATHERFDDEYHPDIIMQEARKYYANIVLPYSDQVRKALNDAAPYDIEIIAPSHGILWRKNAASIVASYREWSENLTRRKALIIYDTMWESTKMIAGAVRKAFEESDYSVVMMNLQHNHISDVMTEVIDAEYICVGSPTLNNNMLPTTAAFLTYLKGLAPKKRKGLAFGSYGWGGQSIQQIDEILKGCGFETMEGIRVKYIPDSAALEKIYQQVKQAL